MHGYSLSFFKVRFSSRQREMVFLLLFIPRQLCDKVEILAAPKLIRLLIAPCVTTELLATVALILVT